MKKLLYFLFAFTVALLFCFSGCDFGNDDDTEYFGLLAEPESYKIAQGETYSFGVTNAKADTYVVIIDSISTKGTWQSINADGYYFSRTVTVNKGEDASGILVPQGGVTSEVQLWVEGTKIKTFKEL
ncbi:MAG: hypothetical protein JXN64_05605 [Spirochaetes bacterium]|nr:hypothetical protein [Spirochaetota bacterium]